MKLKTVTLAMALSIMGLSTSATWASNPRLQGIKPVDVRKIQRITPDAIAFGDGKGNMVSAWKVPTSSGAVRNVPSWQMAWDSMNTNPATQVTFSNTYGGTTSPATLFNDNEKQYIVVNDINMNAGAAGKFAKLVRIGFLWNPNGSAVAGGTLPFCARIFTANKFDNSLDAFGPAYSEPLGEIFIKRTTLAAGLYELSIDMTSVGGALPLPGNQTGGSLVVEFGTLTANEWSPLSGVRSVQPMLAPMRSPGEPQFPGTNPSSSSDLMWVDDSNPFIPGVFQPDYILQDFTNNGNSSFPYSEQYSYDYTSQSAGKLQATAGIFRDANSKSITGSVNFASLLNPTVTRPKTSTFQIRTIAGGILSTQKVSIGAGGSFTLSDPNAAGGTYRIYVRENGWLGLLSGTINTAPNLVTNLPVLSLRNGDADFDNFIGLDDFNILSNAFNSSIDDVQFNAAADFDRDEFVGLDDFNILSNSFNIEGDF